MNRSINVYVNEEDIRFLGNLDTKVSERDQVDIILAIAGVSDSCLWLDAQV